MCISLPGTATSDMAAASLAAATQQLLAGLVYLCSESKRVTVFGMPGCQLSISIARVSIFCRRCLCQQVHASTWSLNVRSGKTNTAA